MAARPEVAFSFGSTTNALVERAEPDLPVATRLYRFRGSQGDGSSILGELDKDRYRIFARRGAHRHVRVRQGEGRGGVLCEGQRRGRVVGFAGETRRGTRQKLKTVSGRGDVNQCTREHRAEFVLQSEDRSTVQRA